MFTLGLVITGNLVTVDHSIVDWMLTDVVGNPTLENFDGLNVHVVFKRTLPDAKSRRLKRKTKSIRGDNCPIIYALKGKDGLITNYTSIKLLSNSFNSITMDITKLYHTEYDFIVPMPSSSPLSTIIATRLAKIFKAPICNDYFKKITIEDAYKLLDRADLSVEDEKSLSYRLKKAKEEVGFFGSLPMKSIPTKYRQAFPPLVYDKAMAGKFTDKKVLLVDDLLATGTTLKCARDLLVGNNRPELVKGICLIGSFGKAKR